MKVAISIPDAIFAKAEALAKRRKLSRSRLYARAVADYVDRHTDDEITELANAEADAMEAQERLILASLGIADPYSPND